MPQKNFSIGGMLKRNSMAVDRKKLYLFLEGRYGMRFINFIWSYKNKSQEWSEKKKMKW